MKRLIWMFVLLLLASTTAACSKQPKISLIEPPDKYNGPTKEFGIFEAPEDAEEEQNLSAVTQVNASLYFLDEKNNRLTTEIRPVIKWNEDDVIVNILNELIKGPQAVGLKSVIAPNTRINKIEQAENILTVNLSLDFLESEDILLARAALVNTLTEMERFKYIKIYVDGRELTADGKEDGYVLGLLTRYPNSLADILAAEAREVEKTDIRRVNRELYFQDMQGMYLIPEVRTISVTQNQHAQAIVEALIKGPVQVNEGLHPTLPKGTKLMNAEVLKGEQEGEDGIVLYFSKEFKTQFVGGAAQEMTTIGSLVYSLTTLPKISFVKVYYENEKGEFIDAPIHSMALNKPLTILQFSDMIGRRIKIYFGDKQGALLNPEYRAMSRSNTGIAKRILQELMTNPVNPDSVRVIPDFISDADFKIVGLEGETAIVNLPPSFFDGPNGNASKIRDLYAIVNALTDPVNTRNIRKVQFVIDGKTIEAYKDISLADPFVRNPALIRE